MTMLHVFVDTSSDKQLAVGTYVILDNLTQTKEKSYLSYPSDNQASSTIAEIRTIIDVLKMIDQTYVNVDRVKVYTDCENCVNLCYKRRQKPNLKKHRYYNFYCELFQLVDKYQIELIWIAGHASKNSRLTIEEKIFADIDKSSRQALRAARHINYSDY